MLDNGYAEKGLTVVSTDDQYAGRGQKGNTWESESGKNLSFSFLVHPRFMAAASQFILSQAMALSVLRVLNRLVSMYSQAMLPIPYHSYSYMEKNSTRRNCFAKLLTSLLTYTISLRMANGTPSEPNMPKTSTVRKDTTLMLTRQGRSMHA